MKRWLPLVAMALAIVALAACDSKKNNIRPPTELTDITPTLAVDALWTANVGRGADRSGVRMRPAVGDGRVYAASVDGDLVALDAKTGRTIWRHQRQWRDTRDTSFSGGPAVADGKLAIGTLDGAVDLFDAASGKLLWRADVGSSVISAPVFTDKAILVRTEDGNVSALKPDDGSRLWVYDRGTVPALSLRGTSGLVARPGAVFFGSDDGKLIAIRLANGGPMWEQTIASGKGRTDIERLTDADSTPLIQGTTVYAAAYHGNLIAVDGPTGRPLWSHPFSSYTGLAGSGTAVIGIDDASNVWSFDDATGGDLWKQDKLAWRWLTAPIVMGSYVVVGDAEGYVHWLDLADGKLAARARPSHDAIRARPVVLDDHTLLVEDVHGRLTAFRVGPAKP